jgi:hypothetical protein
VAKFTDAADGAGSEALDSPAPSSDRRPETIPRRRRFSSAACWLRSRSASSRDEMKVRRSCARCADALKEGRGY